MVFIFFCPWIKPFSLPIFLPVFLKWGCLFYKSRFRWRVRGKRRTPIGHNSQPSGISWANELPASDNNRTSAFGDQSSAANNRPSAFGDQPSAANNRTSAFGDQHSAANNRTSAFGDQSSASTDQRSRAAITGAAEQGSSGSAIRRFTATIRVNIWSGK